MICVIDNTSRGSRALIREHMLSCGMPCLLSDSEHFDRYLPCELIIVTEKYLIPDVRYLAQMYGNHHIISIENESGDLPIEVWKAAASYFGDISYYKKGCTALKDGDIVFCAKKLSLTDTELRIAKMLLLSEKSYTSEQISSFALKDPSPSKVVSHVHRINEKAKLKTGFKLILSKRYCGYFLNRI